jgi:hypothetical protein
VTNTAPAAPAPPPPREVRHGCACCDLSGFSAACVLIAGALACSASCHTCKQVRARHEANPADERFRPAPVDDPKRRLPNHRAVPAAWSPSAEDCILLATMALGGRAPAEEVERFLRVAQREGFPVPIRFPAPGGAG